MAKLLNILVVALALTGVVMVLLRMSSLFQMMPGEAASPAESYDGNFAQRPGLTLLHVAPGLIFVLLGPLQFVTKIRTKHINFHR